METIVILGTAAVTVLWSVRSYFFVSERLALREESPLRLVSIIAPSAYFLVLLFAGWQRVAPVRLDLIGLVVLDAITLLGFVVSFITGAVKRPKVPGIVLLVSYNVVSIAIVVTVTVARNDAVLLIRLTALLRRFNEIGPLSFAWVGLDSNKEQQDLVSLLNRVLVAAFSYVPIATLRFFTGIRHRRRLDRQIERIVGRLSMIERRLDRSDL